MGNLEETLPEVEAPEVPEVDRVGPDAQSVSCSLVELVRRRLKQGGFQADMAYPGQKYPQLQGPAATVHIQRVDRGSLSVTVEVNVICPAAMGGSACELHALRATEILRWEGAVCAQSGCTYDGVTQVYMVSILAAFTGTTGAVSCKIGPGYHVYLEEVYHPFVAAFSETESSGAEPEYVYGRALPVDISQGSRLWKLRLEEQIPAGSPELPEPGGEFTLKIVTDLKTETYSRCCWQSIHREYTRNGLLRIREGFALGREESANE